MICAIVDTASPFTSLDQQKKLIATGPGKMGPHVTASASEPPNSSAAAAGAGGNLPEEMPGLPLPPPSDPTPPRALFGGRIQTLITQYSHRKHAMKLGEVMHSNMHLLPPHLHKIS